jgi:hypothetical protein
VTLGEPTARELVVQVAVKGGAPVRFPAEQLPTLQVIAPVGLTPPVTVAVKVTDVPIVEGFSDDTIPTAVTALLMFSITTPKLGL